MTFLILNKKGEIYGNKHEETMGIMEIFWPSPISMDSPWPIAGLPRVGGPWQSGLLGQGEISIYFSINVRPPKIAKLVNKSPSNYSYLRIIYHSDIGVMFTNLAIERGPHILWFFYGGFMMYWVYDINFVWIFWNQIYYIWHNILILCMDNIYIYDILDDCTFFFPEKYVFDVDFWELLRSTRKHSRIWLSHRSEKFQFLVKHESPI